MLVVGYYWVPGHAGLVGNERVGAVAGAQAAASDVTDGAPQDLPKSCAAAGMPSCMQVLRAKEFLTTWKGEDMLQLPSCERTAPHLLPLSFSDWVWHRMVDALRRVWTG